jgi:tetratricopeptide (TPR) repeat protein
VSDQQTPYAMPGDPSQIVRVESGFGYGVQGADLHVFADRGPIYGLAEYLGLASADTRWLLAQPSRLLNVRFQVVDFTGREQELAELACWRDARTTRLSARWLHGSGGQGKSRLAARLAELSATAGWKVVTVTHGPGSVLPPPGSQDMRTGGAVGLLVIIDYADRWPLSHLTWLFSNALFHHPMPTRFLMVARSIWPWPAIRAALSDQGADTSDQLLEPFGATTGIADRERMFAVARDCFAQRYDIANADHISPSGPLAAAGFGLTLALHMAALVAVDAYSRGVSRPADLPGLSAYLLDRERQHWTRLFENRGEGLDFQTPPSLMARVVFTAALTGATSYGQGMAFLDRLNRESDPSRVLADHATCYPPLRAGAVLEPLYPDRLAEDFLALCLPGHGITGFAAEPWAGRTIESLGTRNAEESPPAYTARMIQTLAAAAGPGRWPHVAEYLASILRADPVMAVEAGNAALSAIAEIPGLDVAVLEAIESQLPRGRRVSLDIGIAALTKRLANHRLTGTSDPAVRADVYREFASRASHAGLEADALEAAADAVAIHRALAKATPRAYQLDLIGSLINYSAHLAAAGQHVAALAASEEAMQICRPLAEAEPGTYGTYLAVTLNNLGLGLSRISRHQDALSFTEEAMTIHRSIEAAMLDRAEELHDDEDDQMLSAYLLLRPELHINLGKHLAALGRMEEAVAAATEGLPWFRSLASDPDTYLPDLARALTSAAEILIKARCTTDALAMIEEAVTIGRQLAEANPAAYLDNLGSSLILLGPLLAEAGRNVEAVTFAQEAVAIHQKLAAQAPTAHLRAHARTLSNLSKVLSAAGSEEQALAAIEGSVNVFRQVADADSASCLADLAEALEGLSSKLSDAGRQEAALAAADEAVTLRRQLTQTNRAAHLPDLARSLYEFSMRLMNVGREHDALTVAQESVDLHRSLAEKDPDAPQPGLQASLVIFGFCLQTLDHAEDSCSALMEAADLQKRLPINQDALFAPPLGQLLRNAGIALENKGLLTEAIAAGRQAVGIYRGLTEPDLPGLASSLQNLGAWLRESGDPEGAATAAEEAVYIYRRLAETDPSSYLSPLADLLNNLVVAMHDLNRTDDALPLALEAYDIYRQLASANPSAYLPRAGIALYQIGDLLITLQMLDEALRIHQESVATYRQLDTLSVVPSGYEANLANSLYRLGNQLSVASRYEEAAALARQAASILGRFAKADSEFKASLTQALHAEATALFNFGLALMEAGRAKEAIDAFKRSGRSFIGVGDWPNAKQAQANRFLARRLARRKVVSRTPD